jgi:hypothetical protein
MLGSNMVMIYDDADSLRRSEVCDSVYTIEVCDSVYTIEVCDSVYTMGVFFIIKKVFPISASLGSGIAHSVNFHSPDICVICYRYVLLNAVN